VSITEHRRHHLDASVSGVVSANRAELARLKLRIERGLLAKKRLRILLTNASTTLTRHRLELREFRARIKLLPVP